MDGGLQPAWARNGQEIFYLATSGFLTVATVSTELDFVVESREQLALWEPYFFTGNRRQFDPHLTSGASWRSGHRDSRVPRSSSSRTSSRY